MSPACALPRVAAALMQRETVRIYHDHLLVKEPGTKQATPWHQDQPYYNVAGRQNVSFWIPVDPVPLASIWYMPRTLSSLNNWRGPCQPQAGVLGPLPGRRRAPRGAQLAHISAIRRSGRPPGGRRGDGRCRFSACCY